jgi:hypothetical protein
MKLHYVTQDIQPNEQSHFLGADMQPDMVTPVWFKAQVIDAKTVKVIKALHGTGLTASVDVDNMWGITKVISFVDDLGCTHSHRYYIPAL